MSNTNRKHGDSLVALLLDNLLAYAAEDSKNIFADSHILLIHFPYQTEESTQSIDAEYGRSIRFHTDNVLHRWLMIGTTLEEWESKL